MLTKKFCDSFLRTKNKNLITFTQRNLKFVKRVIDNKTNEEINPKFEKGETDVQVFDLSGADITEDSLRLDVIQTAVDKLSKKQELLIKNVDKLSEIVSMMSTSIEIITESQMNSKVHSILKNHNLLKERTNPFLKINSMKSLEDYLISFVQNIGVTGAQEVIKKSLNSQKFVDIFGEKRNYENSIESGPNWITGPLNVNKQGRIRNFLSGEVTIIGNNESIIRSIHRAIRIPTLLRRYTSKIFQTLNKSSLIEESLNGLENGLIFLIIGSSKNNSLPNDCFNRVITPFELNSISESLIDNLEGEVYIPNDNEILNFNVSDTFHDSFGSWNLFLESEFNQKTLKELDLNEEENQIFVLSLLLKSLSKHNFKLFIGTCTNDLN
eukprot:gene5122-8720_t